jgi:hypothetical protein
MNMGYYLIGHGTGLGILFGIIAFAIKKWINNIEKTIKENRDTAKAENENTARILAISNKESHDDIKERIANNKDFYSTSYTDLKKDIADVYDLQRDTNGRVGKTEGAIKAIDATCKTRSEIFYEKMKKAK